MNLYIAVVESEKRKGRRIKMAIHASSRARAEAIARRRLAKWTLQTLSRVPGQTCILFQDEFPD